MMTNIAEQGRSWQGEQKGRRGHGIVGQGRALEDGGGVQCYTPWENVIGVVVGLDVIGGEKEHRRGKKC